MLRPITDSQAIKFLDDKATLPTQLTSKQIVEEWSEDAKYRSFFSARVAKADLLAGMRKRINQVVAGKMTKGQAKDWIQEFLVTDGASSMNELGFLATQQELNETNRISELGSTRRISLIVDQNVRMAESVGEWQQFDETLDFFPYVQYRTREDDRVRESHAILNNTVWRAGSPELAMIFPPNDFNCRCFVEQLDEEDARGLNISYTPPDMDKLAPSGYRFNPASGLSGNELPPKEQWGKDLQEEYKKDLVIAESEVKRSKVQKVIASVLGWLRVLI